MCPSFHLFLMSFDSLLVELGGDRGTATLAAVVLCTCKQQLRGPAKTSLVVVNSGKRLPEVTAKFCV